MRSVATIGVYGWTREAFLGALHEADVALLIDVRQRRGVRGPEYAWANAMRLQAALVERRIEYRHHKQLAPTTALRHLQYRADARAGVGKRSRLQLAPEYREAYVREILDRADLGVVLDEMPEDHVAALFCVELDPQACHRSIVADRIAERFRLSVVHLLPSTSAI